MNISLKEKLIKELNSFEKYLLENFSEDAIQVVANSRRTGPCSIKTDSLMHYDEAVEIYEKFKGDLHSMLSAWFVKNGTGKLIYTFFYDCLESPYRFKSWMFWFGFESSANKLCNIHALID